MSITTSIRALRHSLAGQSVKEVYWAWGRARERQARLSEPRLAVFADHVKNEKQRTYAALRPLTAADRTTRMAAAVDWVLRAQQATEDDGVALGFSPLQAETGWMASYPETTGYLITTLLAYAGQFDRNDVRAAALAMADWEIAVQMASGAVQGGPVCPPERQTAAAFNTGMVLDGWCSAYEATGEQRYLEAAKRAATFLTDDLDDRGFFQTNGAFVSPGEIKTYTCLCSWAMVRAGMLLGDDRIKAEAVRAVEAAIGQQNALGWFAHNCLTHSKVPLTHTIGYVLQGVFEVGVLAERQDFIDAAATGLKAVLSRTESNGYLSGRFDDKWRPSATYVCLTGSCQVAIVAYRMADVLGEPALRAAADKLMAFVAATQRLDAGDPGLVGGIAGSFPIMGDYMTSGFPNWATKYFLDGLMLMQPD